MSTNVKECQNEINTLKTEKPDGFLQKCKNLKKSKKAYAALVTDLETTPSVLFFLNSEVLAEIISTLSSYGID